MNLLKCNYSDLLNHWILDPSEIRESKKVVSKAFETLLKLKDEGKVGFLDLPKNTNWVTFEKEGEVLRSRFKTFVHCGMGGSSLGTRVLVEALRPDASILFVDNVDPRKLAHFKKQIDPKTTLFHLVSKSGDTIETIHHYEWVVQILKEKKLVQKDHIIVSTNSKSGFLREEVKKEGYQFYEIPENVGGRFSVFTSVGLLAAAFSGISIKKILEGAATDTSSMVDLSALSYLFYKKYQKNVAVFLIYSDYLKSFGDWLVQLWSESLGKGKEGMFPLVGIGTSAQHSILQLLRDGPDSAWIQFIEVKNTSPLMTISAEATRESLLSAKRPCVQVTIEELNEECLGALLGFYEVVVALLGLSLNVNPFDQPGVEGSKKRIQDLLNQL